MDNYKILNTKTNAIIKLLNELGYAWVPTTNDSEASLLKAHWIIAESSGDIAYSSTETFYEQDSYKELSFNQLNDLVVLKRNDVKDATHVDQYGDKWLYLDERHYVYLNDQWDLPIGEFLERYELKPIKKHLETATGRFDENGEHHLTFSKGLEEKDPALISGADAELVAQAKKFITSDHLNRFEAAEAHLEGHPVQFMLANGDFIDITSDTTLGIFEKDGGYSFRLKPQTIKLNDVEVSAPIKTGVESDSGVLVLFKNNEDRDKFLKAMGY